MGAVPLSGCPPMAPSPPLQQLGFGPSRWRLRGNATLGLRAGGRGHHLFFLPHKSPLLAQRGPPAASAFAPAIGGIADAKCDRSSAPTYEYTAWPVRGSLAIGSLPLGAYFRSRLGTVPAAPVALAATTRDDVHEIIAAVVVGDLVAGSDALEGADDDLVTDRVGLGIGPARMIGV